MSSDQSKNGSIADISNQVNPIVDVVSKKAFGKISTEIQHEIIDNVTQTYKLEIGVMGKFLGVRMPNIAVYCSFLICLLLLLFAFACIWVSQYFCATLIIELTKIIIPVVTMSLGYMFGKNDTK